METSNFISGRSNLDMEVLCPSCSSSSVESFGVSHSFDYGDGEGSVELKADVVAHHCRDCGLEFLDDSAEDAKHEAVCRHLNVLSPSEISALRERLGMSRAEFSKLTRIGEATLGRWERGALIQNAANDQFLYLLGFPENIQRLRDRYLAPSSRGGIVPAVTKYYIITAIGMDKIGGPSEFMVDRFSGIRIEATGQNIITLGDGNRVNIRFERLAEALSRLREDIKASKIDESTKLATVADINCLHDQLASPEPRQGVVSALWNGIERAAISAGLIDSANSIAALIAAIS